MARIRSVHPGLFTDEAFMSASPMARLLMIGLWTEADDNGIFEWKPVVIKARIFPADACDAASLLEEICSLGSVKRFEIANKPYGAIKNFCKFQRPKSPTTQWETTDEINTYIGLHFREDDPTTALRKRLFDKSNGACTYCSTAITVASKRFNSMEIDHDIPRSRGGTDDETNLVASCRACNRQKGTRTGTEYKCDIARPIATKNATSEVASQMEDGGWKEKKEVSEASLPRPGQTPRTVKPSLSMDEFWLPYPRTPVMSKQDCAKQWKRLSEADQRKAIDAVAGYKRFLASKPDHPAVHACRFLSQRRFEGFEEDAAKPAAEPMVFIPFDSPDWKAWQTVQPRTPIQMAAGYGLYFPSKRPQSQSSEAA